MNVDLMKALYVKGVCHRYRYYPLSVDRSENPGNFTFRIMQSEALYLY